MQDYYATHSEYYPDYYLEAYVEEDIDNYVRSLEDGTIIYEVGDTKYTVTI